MAYPIRWQYVDIPFSRLILIIQIKQFVQILTNLDIFLKINRFVLKYQNMRVFEIADDESKVESAQFKMAGPI